MKLYSFFRSLFRRSHRFQDVSPEDVFLDAHNLPQFDQDHFEGRLEQPISNRVFFGFSIFLVLIGCVFMYRLFMLQVVRGEQFVQQSEQNRLQNSLLFAERGVIFDRSRNQLAWNSNSVGLSSFARRQYATTTGMSHLVGYLKYPVKDSSGFYYNTNYRGIQGVEKSFDELLEGQHGKRIVEVDAQGEIISKSTVQSPVDGEDITVSIDKTIQHHLYKFIQQRAQDSGFRGGAGVIMDISTGELIALTSYPEFDSQNMTNGEAETIQQEQAKEGNPFLNRVISGQFIPGSIVKPFIALTALKEDIISPTTHIVSRGTIEIPNPYDPDKSTLFYDWKKHGPVDMREALAVSSNIYFYVIGGGFKDQDGLGITKMADGLKSFGFGSKTGISLSNELSGVVPTPKWKKRHFDDDVWTLGDTFNVAIGQFGFQVTPIQAVRATASIANGGYLLTPHLTPRQNTQSTGIPDIKAPDEFFTIVKEGMRQAVVSEKGTAKGLRVPYIDIAAKTGTAEIGRSSVNSWVTGFFPYENPQYAFTIIMERGPRKNQLGGVSVARQLFDWIHQNKPSFFVRH